MAGIWVGMDIGGTHHHYVAIDDDGNTLLSRRVANDEADLRTLLHHQGQQLVYLPGRFMHSAAGFYPGEGKSDARDAAILADQARVRQDLRTLSPPDAITVNLALLTARRVDLVCDRTRVYNRTHSHLSTIAPALGRALEVRLQGPLILLGSYPTPTALRRIGQHRLTAWLRRRHIRRADALAERALTAAHRQHVIVPGEELTAALITELAHEAVELQRCIREVEHRITAQFHTHPDATLITSMPGIGDVLGAHFVTTPAATSPASPTSEASPPTPASPDTTRQRPGIGRTSPPPQLQPTPTLHIRTSSPPKGNSLSVPAVSLQSHDICGPTGSRPSRAEAGKRCH
ncbi:IS110 family transposase [Embleya sp. NPDC059259]|uniref:IS110 family transposase n=1 Tax=unclassified Embleya TaxID=2699296 RepID=UPI0036B771AE